MFSEQETAVLNEVADGIETASTWVSGGRAAKLAGFAVKLRSLVDGPRTGEAPPISMPARPAPGDIHISPGSSDKVDSPPRA